MQSTHKDYLNPPLIFQETMKRMQSKEHCETIKKEKYIPAFKFVEEITLRTTQRRLSSKTDSAYKSIQVLDLPSNYSNKPCQSNCPEDRLAEVGKLNKFFWMKACQSNYPEDRLEEVDKLNKF